mmetsp:Transcript_84746/g.273958  ORF Transcript_84746/g.273958 Transcript_84746/m.273958 type:complete len:336 (-) Transcript_84746:2-1009(-)
MDRGPARWWKRPKVSSNRFRDHGWSLLDDNLEAVMYSGPARWWKRPEVSSNGFRDNGWRLLFRKLLHRRSVLPLRDHDRTILLFAVQGLYPRRRLGRLRIVWHFILRRLLHRLACNGLELRARLRLQRGRRRSWRHRTLTLRQRRKLVASAQPRGDEQRRVLGPVPKHRLHRLGEPDLQRMLGEVLLGRSQLALRLRLPGRLRGSISRGGSGLPNAFGPAPLRSVLLDGQPESEAAKVGALTTDVDLTDTRILRVHVDTDAAYSAEDLDLAIPPVPRLREAVDALPSQFANLLDLAHAHGDVYVLRQAVLNRIQLDLHHAQPRRGHEAWNTFDVA